MKGRLLLVVTLAALGAVVSVARSAADDRPCPGFCGQPGGPKLLGVRGAGGGRVRAEVLLVRRARVELVVTRVAGARLLRVRPTVIAEHPRETLIGRVPVGGRRERVAEVRLGPMRAGLRSRTVRLAGPGQALSAGEYVLTVNSLNGHGKHGSSLFVRLKSNGAILSLLQPRTAPAAGTAGASAIGQASAVVSGTVNGYGLATGYYFEYGPTTAYGGRTPSRSGGSGDRSVRASASLSGLSLATTYHYRLVATTCSGCRWGTSYGQDRTLTTLDATGLSTQQVDADRAITAYNAMQRYFYAADVYPGDPSGLYVENSPQGGNRYSFLWPFSRAFAATITLAGVPSGLLGGVSYEPDVTDRLTGLSRFWDGTGYDSYPPAPYGKGGDKYYDDAAWVGLSSAQDYALNGDQTALADAHAALNFVYPGGWDADPTSFDPGGIYWVNQGVGRGVNNHNRTTTSNAPNAELALLLGEQDAANAIYGWVNQYLYNVPTSPNYAPGQPALMFDHVTASGAIDHTLWTYNQGTMIAADVREYRLSGQAGYLDEAEAIANTALSTFTESGYVAQPAAFNAIFFRGLLVLYSVTSDASLRSKITQTIQAYADDAWENYRGATGLFRFPSSSGTGYQLLDQGAMVEIYAALAWDPGDYDKLP